MKKKIISCIVILYTLFMAIIPCYNVDYVYAGAIANAAGQIASYFLATIGAVDTATGGAVSSIGGNIFDRVRLAVSDQLGTGIYTDSSGNYVFSGEATNALYDALYSNTSDGLNVRVISDFGSGIFQNGLYFGYSGLVPSDLWYLGQGTSNIGNSVFSQFDGDYICTLAIRNDGSSPYIYASVFGIPSNFAYMAMTNSSDTSSGNILFYDKNGQQISMPFNYCICYYNGSQWVYSSKWRSTLTTWRSLFGSVNGTSWSSENGILNQRYWFGSDYVSQNEYYIESGTTFSGWNAIYNNFPFGIFWSNRSLILGKSLASANGMYQRQNNPGIQVSNVFNVVPSISETVINNNDWGGIYSSYVNSVNEQYQIYINDGGEVPEGQEFNYDILHKYMKSFSQNIINAINNGVSDVETAVLSSNEWLKKIYIRCNDIVTLVTNSNTTLDNINSTLNGISRIESNLSSQLLQLQQTYTLLGQILTAIQNIDSGGGSGGGTTVGGGTVNTWNDLNITINGLPNADILDFIDKGDILTDLLQSVMPFCFVPFVGVIINGLASEPVTPNFTIPFKMSSQMQVNENVNVNLSNFQSLHDIVIALECIAFCIWLIYITFGLFKIIMQMLG